MVMADTDVTAVMDTDVTDTDGMVIMGDTADTDIMGTAMATATVTILQKERNPEDPGGQKRVKNLKKPKR